MSKNLPLKEQQLLGGDTIYINPVKKSKVEKIISDVFQKTGNKHNNSSNSPMVSEDTKGGIDISHINKIIRREGVSSPGSGGLNSPVDVDFDLNEELSQLQKLLNAEIIPSDSRLNRYARAACYSSLSSPDSKDSALSLVAETFRLQEEKAVSALPELKALAAWLE